MNMRIVFGFLAAFCVAAAPFDSSRLTPTKIASELLRPMEMEIAPDGRIFVIELAGKLLIVHPYSQAIATAAEFEVANQQENGLIGIALDPNFSDNHWIYLQYSPVDFEGQHISRFTMKGDLLDRESERLILTFPEQREQCCHHAGSLEFGPQGNLFISTGDNTHPGGDSKGFAPIDERPDRMPFDAQKSAANTHSLTGKVLRIRPTAAGGYTIPDGNLFPADGSQGLPEIYVMGCRNPWRISVDHKSGFLYWGDVGPDAGDNSDRGPRGHDEVNQARKPGFFGWPYFIANNQPYPTVDFETLAIGATFDASAPINESPNNTGRRELPPAQPAFIYYPRASAEPFAMLGSGGRTACAGPVYHADAESMGPTGLPVHFDNTLFIYEWSRHWIKAVHLEENGDIREIEPFLEAQAFRRPIDIEIDARGVMYLLEYGETWGANKDCALWRIDYQRGNRRPTVSVRAEDSAGRAPFSTTVTATASDPDGDDLSYSWRIVPGDGSVVSSEASATLSFPHAGVYSASLTVRDAAGLDATASVPVRVGNDPPTVRFVEPQEGDFFFHNAPVAWKLHVQDHEDGDSADGAATFGERTRVRGELLTPQDLAARGSGSAKSDPPGLAAIKGSDCLNCHAIDSRIVGPAFAEIAKKYRDDEPALETAARRIVEGSTGAWGEIPMVPHPQHTLAETRQMLAWIASLAASQEDGASSGLTGEIVVPKSLDSTRRQFVLSANYRDLGMPAIGSLDKHVELTLRHPKVEAEDADQVEGCQVMSKVVGATGHGHFLRFDNMNLAEIARVSTRTASPDPVGFAALRLHAVDGPLIGKIVAPKSESWGKYVSSVAEIAIPDGVDPRGSLFVVFTDPETKRGNGIMNLDWLQFSR
ncbi:MAG: cytochrome c [Rhodothermales bacterium]|jgi:cytochrome c